MRATFIGCKPTPSCISLFWNPLNCKSASTTEQKIFKGAHSHPYQTSGNDFFLTGGADKQKQQQNSLHIKITTFSTPFTIVWGHQKCWGGGGGLHPLNNSRGNTAPPADPASWPLTPIKFFFASLWSVRIYSQF